MPGAGFEPATSCLWGRERLLCGPVAPRSTALAHPAAGAGAARGLAGSTAATITSAVAAAYRHPLDGREPACDPTLRTLRTYTRREITLVADNIRPRK